MGLGGHSGLLVRVASYRKTLRAGRVAGPGCPWGGRQHSDSDSGQAKTLVYFSISNILAITKINSTKGDRSLYSEAKGSAARRRASRVRWWALPGQ